MLTMYAVKRTGIYLNVQNSARSDLVESDIEPVRFTPVSVIPKHRLKLLSRDVKMWCDLRAVAVLQW